MTSVTNNVRWTHKPNRSIGRVGSLEVFVVEPCLTGDREYSLYTFLPPGFQSDTFAVSTEKTAWAQCYKFAASRPRLVTRAAEIMWMEYIEAITS